MIGRNCPSPIQYSKPVYFFRFLILKLFDHEKISIIGSDFYFPFLILTMIKMPDYFIMVYAIITGAHFFPYSWFYKTNWYAIFAGIIAVGVLVLGLNLPNDKMYFVAIFTSILLLILTICLYFDTTKKLKRKII